MAMDDDPRQNALVRALAAYLRDNPFASDTAEGIHRWWLGAYGDPPLEEVRDALETMAQLGLVEATVAVDGRRRYRRRARDEQLAPLAGPGGRQGEMGA